MKNFGNNKTNYKKLLEEFYSIKRPRLRSESFDSVAVFSAEEVSLSGENGERIREGLELTKEIKASKFIFLGTKTHNQNLKKYLGPKKYSFEIIYVSSSRTYASTRTEILDFAKYLTKKPLSTLLIVTHAYHIPRSKRYFEKYIPKSLNYDFWPIGKIKTQQKQVEKEIEKIIKYSSKGNL